MNIKAKVKRMAQLLGGEYVRTFRGVPVVVIKFPSNLYIHSFCYMASRGLWRGFYPYTPKGGGWNNLKQTKKDFKTDDELVDFVEGKKNESK